MQKRKMFYEDETPELITVKDGELRLFRKCGRLAVSKPQWEDVSGVSHVGKTVSIDLASNKGNEEMIQMLEDVIHILKE